VKYPHYNYDRGYLPLRAVSSGNAEVEISPLDKIRLARYTSSSSATLGHFAKKGDPVRICRGRKALQ
jgi:hypothetical protein